MILRNLSILITAFIIVVIIYTIPYNNNDNDKYFGTKSSDSMREISSDRSSETYYINPDTEISAFENSKDEHVFWCKVFFSGLFSMAALFIILSQKYEEDTRKWAFSILALIAGVWIGTIS